MSIGEMRNELLSAALERKTVTYGHLMQKFGLSRGDSGKTVVGMLGELDKVEREKGAPGFAAIVVRKDTGYPGGGFFCWDDIPVGLRRAAEKCQDPKLTIAEKTYIRQQQEIIWGYYRAHSGP
jgi:hypothetical protein